MNTEFDPVAVEHPYPALACGVAEYDGLLVAYLPKLDAVMQEFWLPSERLTLYCAGDMAVDAMDEHRGQRVKWWRVRNAARECRMQQVEPIWQGPAGEFTLARLPAVPRPTLEHKLYMRAFSHGPWIKLERNEDETDDSDRAADSDASPTD